jgi:hypothetical protein
MAKLIVVGLGAVVLLAALGGFLRGLWVMKPRRVPGSSEYDWSQSSPDSVGHGGDVGDGGH